MEVIQIQALDVHMQRTEDMGCGLMVTETGGSQGQRRVLAVMK